MREWLQGNRYGVAPARKVTNQTVHALLQGQPLCRFTTDTPNLWPPDDVWTYAGDIENINCTECKTQAQKLVKK